MAETKQTNGLTLQTPNDRGPVYAETRMDRIPVEPFSTYSNLLFLVIVIYWALKTRMNFRKFPILTFAIPILLIGFIGGFIYHATRSSNIWLYLDYMPIMILVLMSAIYFWKQIFGNWIITFCVTLIPIFIYRFVYEFIEISDHQLIACGYILLALIVTVPIVLHCILMNRKNWPWLALCAVSFAIAIICRQLDAESTSILPMGSHFLWHIFGATATFFGLQYLYSAELIAEKKRHKNAELHNTHA